MVQQRTDQFLLATKLSIPPVRSGLVTRPRLLSRLEAAIAHPFTLLAAPAGFGKTMLLSAWIRQLQRPVAWVSLDSSDDDPVQFWTYVIAALDKLHPGIGKIPLSLLQSEQSAPIETVLVALMNALSTLQEDIVLVLDDYHVIEAHPIHNAISFLLDHLPPQLHLIIASRVDPPLPLSRLRVRNQLLELRADDLRFTQDEAASFLNDIMGFHLTQNDIAALEARTEGWIAGLQLAALSMQGRKDIASFISAFAGSHRYIVDYLTEEVLRQQPEHVRTFLLQTSILERLNGSLCDAVSGQTHSQEMLEYLELANLFLIPLDDERYWYRYHHLFADALRFRLNQAYPDLLSILHDRASEWFENSGFIPDAINHALAAKDYERAATLIEPVIYPMFNQGVHATVRHWLKALPEDVLFARPSLSMLYAWAFLYVGEIESCKRPLDVAEQAWRAEGDLSRLGEVYTFRASVALIQGDAVGSINYSQQALTLLPEGDLLNRCNCTLYLGGSYLLVGDVTEAHRLLSEACAMCRPVHLYSMLYAMNFLAGAEIIQGKLHQAAETSQEVIKILGGRLSVHASRAHSRLGSLYCEWNNLDLAASHVRQAVTLGEQAGQEIYMSLICLASAQVLWRHGEVEEAFTMLDKAEHAAQLIGNRIAAAQVKAFRAQLNLDQGNLAQAERWSKEVGIDTSDEPTYEHEAEYLMLARLGITQHRAREIVALLDRMLHADETAERTGNVISVLAFQAIAHWQLGNTEQALSILNRLLILTELEGYTRIFVDEEAPMQELLSAYLALPSQQRRHLGNDTLSEYVRKLLAAFPQAETKPAARPVETSATPSPLIEPLSTRKQEVLELLAAGMSNSEIAEQLTVTVGTVKTHIKSIYGKLGVHSRTQAIARARDLRLL